MNDAVGTEKGEQVTEGGTKPIFILSHKVKIRSKWDDQGNTKESIYLSYGQQN